MHYQLKRPPPPPPKVPPASERSSELDSELVALDMGLSTSAVDSALAFRAEVGQKIAETPGLIRYGWDELPSRSGFVEVVGTVTAATVESLEGLGMRVLDGFDYNIEERRSRVHAVTGYLVENGFKGAIVRHVGDQVLVELAESQHRTIDPSVLSDRLSLAGCGRMPVLRIGGQSRRSQGRRNRHSLAWNCGFENAASGDEWSLRRAVCGFPHPAK